ncbi:MAG: hypothetical protein MJZ32_12575 [Bacteroidaceae bacterium]|nr:hypothetical protein [Bacteroidaceae bacterium]
MQKTIISLGAAMLLTACTVNSTQEDNKQTKSLVVYYSQTGTTAKVADLFAEKTGADIDSIVAVNPYDSSFEETIARCQKEMETGEMPELKQMSHDIAKYDTLYIGCPVWFGTMALPVQSYLKQANLEGKVVIPFVTFGSGGLETTVAEMKKIAPKANFLDANSLIGYGVRNARVEKAAEEVEQFLIDIKVKEGKVSEKPNYGEQQPLTDEDKKIFDEACGDYQMPLGTPISVASNEGKTNYQFVVESKDAQGNTSNATILVVKEEGSKAEFTKVIR